MGVYKDFIWDFHLDLLELNRITHTHTYIYIYMYRDFIWIYCDFMIRSFSLMGNSANAVGYTTNRPVINTWKLEILCLNRGFNGPSWTENATSKPSLFNTILLAQKTEIEHF